MRFFAEFILRGRMQAMLVASSVAMLSLAFPPVSIVSSAAIALVALRRGAYEGLLVLLISSVAAGLLGWYLIGNYQFSLGYSLVLWFPVWLISVVLREGRSLNLALDIAVLLGVLIVIGVYMAVDNPAAMWNAQILAMLEPMLGMPDAPVEDIKTSVAVAAHYMTGVMAAGSVSGLLLGVFLARWWQAILFNPGGFRKEFERLNTRPSVAIGSLVVVGLGMAGLGQLSQVAANIAVLFVVLYGFIGASVAHVLICATRAKRILLPLFYVLLFVVPHILLPVALLGFAEVWLNLRLKVSNQSSA